MEALGLWFPFSFPLFPSVFNRVDTNPKLQESCQRLNLIKYAELS